MHQCVTIEQKKMWNYYILRHKKMLPIMQQLNRKKCRTIIFGDMYIQKNVVAIKRMQNVIEKNLFAWFISLSIRSRYVH